MIFPVLHVSEVPCKKHVNISSEHVNNVRNTVNFQSKGMRSCKQDVNCSCKYSKKAVNNSLQQQIVQKSMYNFLILNHY